MRSRPRRRHRSGELGRAPGARGPSHGLAALVRGLATLMVGCAIARPAAGDDVSERLDRIARAQQAIETFEARFVQRRTLDLFEEELVSRGRVSFKRPDRFRWDVEEPARITMIVTGNEVLTRSDGAAEPYALTLPVSGGEITGLFTGSFATARRLFAIRWTPGTGGADRLELRPTQPALARAIRAVTLDLAPRDALVQRIVLEEASGDRIDIHFTDLEINGSIGDDRFTFGNGAGSN